MQLEVGKIYEGKVTGITKFGAFVELERGTTGMVHISEIANTYVNEIKDHLTEGQTVKVKLLSLGEGGKISLSIKKALPAPEKKQNDRRPRDNHQRGERRNDENKSAPRQRRQRSDKPAQELSKLPPPEFDVRTTSGDADFEDMIAKFKASSEERFSDLKHVMDNKRRNTSRRR